MPKNSDSHSQEQTPPQSPHGLEKAMNIMAAVDAGVLCSPVFPLLLGDKKGWDAEMNSLRDIAEGKYLSDDFIRQTDIRNDAINRRLHVDDIGNAITHLVTGGDAVGDHGTPPSTPSYGTPQRTGRDKPL